MQVQFLICDFFFREFACRSCWPDINVIHLEDMDSGRYIFLWCLNSTMAGKNAASNGRYQGKLVGDRSKRQIPEISENSGEISHIMSI